MTALSNSGRGFARRDILFLSFFSAFYLLWGLGAGSLASWDEAYYALLSLDIFKTGDWIHLRSLGVDCYDKPPLYFWVTAVFYHLGGVTETATRLGSALSGWALVLGVYALGRKILSREAALAGAVMLLSSKDFIHYARFGTLDVMNLCWMVFAALNGIGALEARGRRERAVRWLLFWTASALAFMTKGAPVLVLWGVLGLWAVGSGRGGFWRAGFFWVGLVLFGFLVIPWHVAAWAHDPEKFTQDFLVKHYLSRTGQAVEGHTGGSDFYLRKVLINKHKPWFVLEAVAFGAALVGCIRRRVQGSGVAFLLLWVGIFFGLFSFGVQTKLPWYIMPAYPALTLLAGWQVTRWLRGRAFNFFVAIAALVPLAYWNSPSAFWHDHAPAIKVLAAAVNKAVPEQNLIHLYNYHEQPAANFYWRRRIAYLDTPDELSRAQGSGIVGAVVVRTEDEPLIASTLSESGFDRIASADTRKEHLRLWIRV